MQATKRLERVLIVDDEPVLRERLARAFSERGYAAETASNLASSKACLREFKPTHVVVDLRLGAESGLEVVKIAAQECGAKTVMLTGYGSIATALEAVRLGAVNYLAKPVGFAEIESALFGAPLKASTEAGACQVPSLEQVEWEHIQRVLLDCGGNITRAAKQLGLHRQALQRKLRKQPSSPNSR